MVFHDDPADDGQFGYSPTCQKHHHPFILEVLVNEGEKQREVYLRSYDYRKPCSIDRDLLKPLEAAHIRAERAQQRHDHVPSRELQRLKDHVEAVHAEYKHKKALLKTSPKQKSRGRTGETRVDPLLPITRKFAEGPSDLVDLENVEEVKASFAYSLSADFGFSMAFSQLCLIKSHASKSAGLTLEFAECMSIPGSYLRIWDSIPPEEHHNFPSQASY
jgi:hypothetical protein